MKEKIKNSWKYEDLSNLSSIAIINLLRQINIAGLSPLVYIICINVLSKDDASLGLVSSLTSIGYLLFSYLCGYIGDHLSVKKSFLLSLLISTLSFCSLLFLAFLQFDYYYMFLIALILISFSDTLFQTSFNSRLPELVNKSSLAVGNSILQLTTSIGGLLGPVVIAVSYSKGDLQLIMLVLLLLNFLNMIKVWRIIPVANGIRDHNEYDKDKTNETLSFVKSVEYILNNQELVYILITTLLINLSFSLIQVVQILHMVRVWNIPEVFALTINSYAGLGAVLGSVFAPLLARKSYKIAVIIGVVLPSCMAVFLLLPSMNFWFVCLIFILLRFSRSIGAIMRVTIQQIMIDKKIIGAVTGTMMTITWGINPLGNILSGYLSQYMGTGFVLFIATAGLLLASYCMVAMVRCYEKRNIITTTF